MHTNTVSFNQSLVNLTQPRNTYFSNRKVGVSRLRVNNNLESAQLEKSSWNPNLCTRRYVITGSQRISNYWWASVISLGGLSFLLSGFASFLNQSFWVFNPSRSISFFPQGLIMCFYGSLGLLFGIYLWCTILWGVGNGFNEFDKKKGVIRIFRWGLPGKDRRIDLVYKLEQVETVRVELKEGINPRRTISLRLKKAHKNSSNVKTTVGPSLNSDIPLTRIGQPVGLEDIESEASQLAQFLQVPLDSFYEL